MKLFGGLAHMINVGSGGQASNHEFNIVSTRAAEVD